jgi:outer membrane protein assembly factor BamB
MRYARGSRLRQGANRFALAGGLVLGGVAGMPAATAAASCASGHHPGGEWTSLNHDLSNTRFQPRERTIGPARVRSLEPAWTFRVPEEAGRDGGVQSTPIVAGGCLYFTTSGQGLLATNWSEGLSEDSAFRGGVVYALNADTGELVWKTPVNGFVLGLAAADGLIYVLPSAAPAATSSGPGEPRGAHAVALDSRTGEIAWVSRRLDDDDPRNGAVINASPVVFTPRGSRRPMVFVPMSVGGGDGARVPLHFLDARTGRVVKRFHALSKQEYAAGYGGAGIWSTAAFDPGTGHLYAGTADSEGHTRQHRYNNAIVKIDADPARRTFGTVVDAYSGTSEHYDLDRRLPGWQDNAICRADPALIPNQDRSQSTGCLELDLDFGSSPVLYTDAHGRRLVAELQKSGVLHAVDTAGMDAAWTKVLSGPDEAGHGATGASDGTHLYVPTSPNLLSSFDRTAGAARWTTPTGASAMSYQPVTTANGVVYGITDAGSLVAVDALTGLMLVQRPISLDAGLRSCLGTGAGVAVARNTVYAPCDAAAITTVGSPGAIVAYRAG